jgi:hypothetical protein
VERSFSLSKSASRPRRQPKLTTSAVEKASASFCGGALLSSPASDGKLVRPEGFEPPTLGSEDRCSIQLSYGRTSTNNGRQFTSWSMPAGSEGFK